MIMSLNNCQLLTLSGLTHWQCTFKNTFCNVTEHTRAIRSAIANKLLYKAIFTFLYNKGNTHSEHSPDLIEFKALRKEQHNGQRDILLTLYLEN